MKLDPNDKFDFYEEKPLTVLFKPGHYDALYTTEYLTRCSDLLAYELPSPALSPKEVRLQCCRCQGLDGEANVVRLSCGDTIHRDCLNIIFGGSRKLLEFLEEEKRQLPDCPKCRRKISREDMCKAFWKDRLIGAHLLQQKKRESLLPILL
jgi:hypothetical protein